MVLATGQSGIVSSYDQYWLIYSCTDPLLDRYKLIGTHHFTGIWNLEENNTNWHDTSVYFLSSLASYLYSMIIIETYFLMGLSDMLDIGKATIVQAKGISYPCELQCRRSVMLVHDDIHNN